MTRVFLAIIMLSALAACNGPTSLPFNSNEAQANFPGGETKGVAAKYVVYTINDSTVSPSTFIAAFAYTDPKPIGGTAFAGAIVTYPDNSTQTTDSNGAFDAAQSSYAAAHPEDPSSLADVTVTISGSAFAAIQTTVFAPSAQVEASEMSGTIPAPADSAAVLSNRSRHTLGYIWSCNPADYEQQGFAQRYTRIRDVQMLDRHGFLWYTGHAYGCATDQPAKTATVIAARWRLGATSGVPVALVWDFEIGDRPTMTPETIAIWASPSLPGLFPNRHLVLMVNNLGSTH